MTALEKIKKLSKEKGWSLQTVAEKAGIGKNSIYRWNTKTPSTDSLQKVAKVLDVPIGELLDSTTPETTDSRIDVDDIINNQRRLFYKNEELSDEDKDFIDTFLRTYLESKEGQDRLRKNGYKGK